LDALQAALDQYISAFGGKSSCAQCARVQGSDWLSRGDPANFL